jgi:hypothetical protein
MGFETRCESVRRVDREKEMGGADSLHLILSPNVSAELLSLVLRKVILNGQGFESHM